jgi:leucyl-tRNA synthetase
LFYNNDQFVVSNEKATPDELKVLHRTIKKINDDVERFSFNTCVSAFMICVNDLNDLKCNKREILEPLMALLAPFAPHIAEELWNALGHNTSVVDAQWPELNESFLVESTVTYPVSFNGKMRFKLDLPADMNPKEIEKKVLDHESAAKWIEGKTIRKIIIVPKKIINIVVG